MYDKAQVDEAVDGELDNLLERARAKRLSAEYPPPKSSQSSEDPDADDKEGGMLAEMLEEQDKSKKKG